MLAPIREGQKDLAVALDTSGQLDADIVVEGSSQKSMRGVT